MAARRLSCAALAAAILTGGCALLPPGSSAACRLDAVGTVGVSMLRNVPLVVARVDGTPLRFVLDTGSESTFLTSEAARRLDLRADPASARRAVGVGGSSLNAVVIAPMLRIGDAILPNQSFTVGALNWQIDNDPPDGFLGSDVLAEFDIDLDLPRGQMTLYRPRDCAAAAPPWSGPYSVVPLRPSPAGIGLFGIPALLDGQLVSATLDTGAEYTTVAASTARALGISATDLRRDEGVPVFGFGPNLQTSRRHIFREIAIGEEVEVDAPLIVAELPPLSGDLLLGSDYLSQHRVYLSYATQRMFIGRATGPQTALATLRARR